MNDHLFFYSKKLFDIIIKNLVIYTLAAGINFIHKLNFLITAKI